jgi:diguanylate cyclase (GGDEF)-like protein/PAS domain S-box-containing protein
MAEHGAIDLGRASVEDLLDDRHLLDVLLEYSPDHIYFKDRQSRFVRVSRSLAEWMGLSDPVDAIGRSDEEFFAQQHAGKARGDEGEIMRSGCALVGMEECEVWPDGRQTWVSTTKAPLRDSAGAIIGVFGMSRDITTRKAADDLVAAQAVTLEKQAQLLRDLASKDDLTGLLNRRGFFETAAQAIEAAARESLRAVVFFVDLDDLKRINDRYGHAVGDRALIAVADGLRNVATPQRTAGRIGGDEFCLLETAARDAVFLTESGLRSAIANAAAATELPELSASIGCVAAPPGSDLDQLIARSDREMYLRKARRASTAPPAP